MAVLNIRNLPDEVHTRLRQRAARNGRSMEAEARAILAEICLRDVGAEESLIRLKQTIDRLYGNRKPKGVVDAFIADRRREAGKE